MLTAAFLTVCHMFFVTVYVVQSKLVLVRLDVLETFNDRYEEFRYIPTLCADLVLCSMSYSECQFTVKRKILCSVGMSSLVPSLCAICVNFCVFDAH